MLSLYNFILKPPQNFGAFLNPLNFTITLYILIKNNQHTNVKTK